ncbi:hypothetical protein ACFY0P_49175 [Streptomyces sp. NPDC001714]|uniref:hypothetical protein n=1 Tax=Streptomyces sp. NPDC001714 TaxID=3364603 RepID=UPI00369D2CC8
MGSRLAAVRPPTGQAARSNEPSTDQSQPQLCHVGLRNRHQGFPSHHVFAGSEGDQKLQVGDAVPVTVATWAAQKTLKALPS